MVGGGPGKNVQRSAAFIGLRKTMTDEGRLVTIATVEGNHVKLTTFDKDQAEPRDVEEACVPFSTTDAKQSRKDRQAFPAGRQGSHSVTELLELDASAIRILRVARDPLKVQRMKKTDAAT